MKNKKALLIILVIILMLLSGVLGFVLRDLTSNNKEKNNTEEKEKKEEKETKDEESIKKRINDIMEIGLYHSGMGDLSADFYNGKSEITRLEKLEMTYISLVYIKDIEKRVGPTPEKYKDDDYFTIMNKDPEGAQAVFKMKITDFEEEYKYLFNEEKGSYEADEIQGCPHPFIKDEELGEIYMSRACGGGDLRKFTHEIIKEETDENYYYFYVKEGYDGDLKEVLWKFDKDGNFVSTTNNG